MSSFLLRYPVQLFVSLAGVIVLTEWLIIQSQAFARRPTVKCSLICFNS